MESEILGRYGYRTQSIDVEGLKGRGWRKSSFVLLKLPKCMMDSFAIVKRFRPQFVLGVGGYSSGPLCVASRIMGVPTAIHEQNSFPGITNRLLCRFADRVFISFDESRDHFPAGKVVLTGNPVREDLLSKKDLPRTDGKSFTVLVLGGSQGAKAINKAFVEALDHLRVLGRDLDVIHQTGPTDFERVTKEYSERDLRGEVVAFIQEMASAYHRAHLVVSRAGATTLFELAALGKPSILIPYPFAANQHQETNARALALLGGAEVIDQKDLTGERLGQALVRYMDDPSALKEMGERARRMARPDAAKTIVDHLLEMAR